MRSEGLVWKELSPQLTHSNCTHTHTLHLCPVPSSTYWPFLVGWINRFFFWLLFSHKKKSSNLSHKIFTYECRFKQHVQDWAIPR